MKAIRSFRQQGGPASRGPVPQRSRDFHLDGRAAFERLNDLAKCLPPIGKYEADNDNQPEEGEEKP